MGSVEDSFGRPELIPIRTRLPHLPVRDSGLRIRTVECLGPSPSVTSSLPRIVASQCNNTTTDAIPKDVRPAVPRPYPVSPVGDGGYPQDLSCVRPVRPPVWDIRVYHRLPGVQSVHLHGPRTEGGPVRTSPSLVARSPPGIRGRV